MPLQATSGAASYDAFGGGVPYIPQYIEEVFSTWLYTGTGSALTITNGIDLAGKGGMVWIKSRSNAYNHWVVDSARGTGSDKQRLQTNTTAAQSLLDSTAFGATGFTVYNDSDYNANAATYTSWTFRKQPKFFDVVTYTGNGSFFIEVAHSLGSAPGFIAIKPVSEVGDWICAARRSSDGGFQLGDKTTRFGFNSNNSSNSAAGGISNNPPANFSPNYCIANGTVDGTARDFVNKSGVTYVAYLFAHNAGGFGLTGTDNVISCGSFTTDGSGYADVNLGYEPQWILMKASSAAGAGENWITVDNMRGLLGTGADYKAARLYPNLSNAEASLNTCQISSTGFKAFQSTSVTYIYIAIRRGPMKVPTTGTSVFGLNARTGTGANATVTGSAGVSDAVLIKNRGSAVASLFASRLTGTGYLVTSSTASEVAAGTTILQANPWDVMDGVKVGTTSTITNASGSTFINYLFDRAPGFFDVVCYTGTDVAGTVAHNLRVPPEIIFVKDRDIGLNGFVVYCEHILAAFPARQYRSFVWLNVASDRDSGFWNNTSPTASVFSVGASSINTVGKNYIAYLFASCPGVSKVGSYTGNGSSQTINCGFTGGARFVMIKRTDSTGDWYVWDTARGIVAGNDPHLSLNTTAAEVTSNDTIDTDNTGFVVNQVAATNVNVNAATYIFLAIA
jgi:hypothetical protein